METKNSLKNIDGDFVCLNCGRTCKIRKCSACQFLKGLDFADKLGEIITRAEKDMGKLFAHFPDQKIDKYKFILSNYHIENSKQKEVQKCEK